MNDTAKKLTHCSHCGKSSFIWIGEGERSQRQQKEQTQCFNNREYMMVKKISRIIYTDKSPYEKKIALFNLVVKRVEVGDMKVEEKKRVDYLLKAHLYSDLAKQSMEDYKKTTAEMFSKTQ